MSKLQINTAKEKESNLPKTNVEIIKAASAGIAQGNAQNVSADNSKVQYDAHEMRENKKVRDKCA